MALVWFRWVEVLHLHFYKVGYIGILINRCLLTYFCQCNYKKVDHVIDLS